MFITPFKKEIYKSKCKHKIDPIPKLFCRNEPLVVCYDVSKNQLINQSIHHKR